MATRILVAALACLAMTAQALPMPISFFNTTFDTTAIAVAEGGADIDTDASPPGVLPLSSSAVQVGVSDLATADAFGDAGFLSTSASATGILDLASGVATSHFSGSFINHGLLSLYMNFDTIGFASGTGVADGSLFVTLTNDGTTLISDVFTTSGPLNFFFDLPIGSVGVLDLLLVSEANAMGAAGGGVGDGFNLALVSFTGTVPLPATWLLVVIGIGALGAVRRRIARGQ